MKLSLNIELARNYRNPSQKIRVITENWVEENIYCPACGREIRKFPNNRPVADFFCPSCREEFELKSKKGNTTGNKFTNGAYHTMIKRILSGNNPNFLFLTYDRELLEVTNFLIIPKTFFIPEIIEKRKPLSARARRTGWTGCNIILRNIPDLGKVYFIRNKKIIEKETVLNDWKRVSFMYDQTIRTKGWLMEIIKYIEQIPGKHFELNDLYYFETELALKFPGNKHIRAKIRQQLQMLRDKGLLSFKGRGKYEKLF